LNENDETSKLNKNNYNTFGKKSTYKSNYDEDNFKSANDSEIELENCIGDYSLNISGIQLNQEEKDLMVKDQSVNQKIDFENKIIFLFQ